WQVVRHASPSDWLPSSHCSPGSMTLLPHEGSEQSPSQPSAFVVLPSSHVSPFTASTCPSPQISVPRQSARQPSPATVFPSSQASLRSSSTAPSPQNSTVASTSSFPATPLVCAE